jgi:hypothetical protein
MSTIDEGFELFCASQHAAGKCTVGEGCRRSMRTSVYFRTLIVVSFEDASQIDAVNSLGTAFLYLLKSINKGWCAIGSLIGTQRINADFMQGKLPDSSWLHNESALYRLD